MFSGESLRTIPHILPFLLLLAVAGCSPVLATEPAIEPVTAALFVDDFSDPQSGWTPAPVTDAEAGYADGAYRLYTAAANRDIRSGPGLNLADVRIEADAIRIGGDRNNRFGLICRLTQSGDYYIFLVSSDGYYGIGKVTGSQYALLGSEALLPSDKIPTGTTYLHLRADCVGERLVLYVNGQKLHEASDPDLKSGDVGLAAGAYQAGGAEILFDNFAVYAP